jgi:protein-tyrosine phosphatase
MTEFEDPTAFDIEFDARTERMVGIATHGYTPFDVPFISQIEDNLWQGGCEYGLVLPDFIRHVISLYKWEDYVHGPLDSHEIVTMYDSAGVVDGDEVDRLANLVNDRLATGDPVLVHCQAGLNRSSLIAARSMMLRENNPLSADDAITLIRDRRSPACLCNPTFEQWLRDRDEWMRRTSE